MWLGDSFLEMDNFYKWQAFNHCMEKGQEDFISWDFNGSNTKEDTHRIHTYPAMMIPQIARRLIYLYGGEAKTLLDPFMGSGTSLVEASLRPHIKEAHGFDLNPLAYLISKVKTTKINPKLLEMQLKQFSNTVDNVVLPEFKNIEFWFKPLVIRQLAMIKNQINSIKDKKIRDFFRVCFSETIRNVSNTRNNEFKLYRMQKEKLDKFDPEVFAKFKAISINNIQGMRDYILRKGVTRIYSNNLNSMNELPLRDQSIDIIVTSPPYGDSRTTVAYGQFSRLALQWLDYEDVSSLDNRLLGGKAWKDLEVKINSKTLKKTIKEIAKIDEKRAREVLSFYEDFDKCVIQLDRVMAKKGFICFVVGNRTVKGINILTDKIMIEMFMSRGNYKHLTTHERAIPNKRMPSMNSPTNMAGKKITTMCNEYIFILQKL
jgi:site-specific DNA-methyltransferase (cytosine-N4-specific)